MYMHLYLYYSDLDVYNVYVENYFFESIHIDFIFIVISFELLVVSVFAVCVLLLGGGGCHMGILMGR